MQQRADHAPSTGAASGFITSAPVRVDHMMGNRPATLFTRDKRRIVELTDAGRLFVEEARSALSHTERAAHLARAAHNGSDTILTLGAQRLPPKQVKSSPSAQVLSWETPIPRSRP